MVVVPNDVLLRPLFPSYSLFCLLKTLSYNTQKSENRTRPKLSAIEMSVCIIILFYI